MDNLKKLSLFIILDCYVTKNAIEDFLLKEHTEIKKKLCTRYSSDTANNKIEKYLLYLNNELKEIEAFLNDSENMHWEILGYNRKFFDDNLPKHKRKIQWFHSIDRYPFDYNIFLPSSTNTND